MAIFRRSTLLWLQAAVILIPAILVIGPHFDVRLPLVAAQRADWSRESGGGGEGAGGGSFAETSSLSYACPQEMASRPHSDTFDPSSLQFARFISSEGRLYYQQLPTESSPTFPLLPFSPLLSPFQYSPYKQPPYYPPRSYQWVASTSTCLAIDRPPPSPLLPVPTLPPSPIPHSASLPLPLFSPFPLFPLPPSRFPPPFPSPSPLRAASLLSAKFISVGRLYEQLSKARLHLGEALSVARHTGRTLILPSVGNSRIGTVADYAFPFCTYFDPGRLGQFVPWVSEEFFYGQVVPAWRAAGRGGGSVVALVLGDAKMKACDVRASYAKIGRNTNTPGLQPNASLRADPSLLLNRALLSPALCTRTCTTKRRAKPPGAEDLLGRDSGATVLPGEEPMVALGRTGGEVGEMEDEDGKREKEGEGGNERERRKGGEEREGSVIGGEKGKEGSILGKDEPDRNADVAVVFKSSPLMCLSRIGRLASEARRSLVYPPHLHLAVDHLITKHIQLQAGGESGGGGEEDSAENGERGQMHGGGGGGGGEGVVVVAAHWRVEKALRAGVRQRQMAACARGLVDTVRGWATRVGGVSGGSGGRENEGAGGAEGKEGGEQQVAVFLATDLTPDNRALRMEHREAHGPYSLCPIPIPTPILIPISIPIPIPIPFHIPIPIPPSPSPSLQQS
ncbi:unnamed protein product [Closterium sp. NIES-53]